MEKISVVIPVYNAAEFLPACIRSVLGQTHQRLELILVNDGSSDGSGQICDDFAAKDSRVRVYHQENRGVSAARNLGIAQASGEYLSFLDADDVVPPDYLEVLLNACKQADISVCDVVCVREGREITRFTHEDGCLSQTEALNFLLERQKINSGPYAKLFRREVLKGLAFPPLKAYEDILFVRDAFSRAVSVAVTNQTEYRYIQNPQGAMSRFFKAPSLDIVRASENILDFLGGRTDLSPACFYTTVSHLMQYVQVCAEADAGKAFIGESRKLMRKYLRKIMTCTAFPWKEKITYSLFVCGWLYQNRTIKRIGG